MLFLMGNYEKNDCEKENTYEILKIPFAFF